MASSRLPELIVHAHPHDVDFVAIPRLRGRKGRSASINSGRSAEIVVQVLDPRRPIVGEAILDTAAGGPSRAGVTKCYRIEGDRWKAGPAV